MFKSDDDTAYHLYGTVVAQARQTAFYTDFDVPDTLDGRFDMIILHAFLVFRRLEETGEAGHQLAQQSFDVLFRDMDQSLREMGVGDLSVPKKIKTMAKAFYGRVAAYSAALEQETPDALEKALQRNIYPDVESSEAASRRLADYVRATLKQLQSQSLEELQSGEVYFPALSEYRNKTHG
ncbi:MAG: hypothetical protein K8F25_02115 [Fimbriimonadaceae bacterium]|nr:hypothetical protein [Alphaproteobacteria bacterium]